MQQILEVINDFGIGFEDDLINTSDSVNFKIEDILYLISESYLKSSKIKNRDL